MPKDISSRAIKTKKGDIITGVRGNQSVVRWKDNRDVYVLTNMHTPPVEGNFCDESGHAVKPLVIWHVFQFKICTRKSTVSL
jgi:hypothetical protein